MLLWALLPYRKSDWHSCDKMLSLTRHWLSNVGTNQTGCIQHCECGLFQKRDIARHVEARDAKALKLQDVVKMLRVHQHSEFYEALPASEQEPGRCITTVFCSELTGLAFVGLETIGLDPPAPGTGD